MGTLTSYYLADIFICQPYDSLGIHPAGSFWASFGSYSFPYILVSSNPPVRGFVGFECVGTLTVIEKRVSESEYSGLFGVIWVKKLFSMESWLVSL